MTKMAKIDTLFMTKPAKNQFPLVSHTYLARTIYKRVPPPPRYRKFTLLTKPFMRPISPRGFRSRHARRTKQKRDYS